MFKQRVTEIFTIRTLNSTIKKEIKHRKAKDM